MKRFSAVLFILILVSSLVTAYHNDEEVGSNPETGVMVDAVDQDRPEPIIAKEEKAMNDKAAESVPKIMAENKSTEMAGQVKAKKKDKIKGLENALTKVTNENAIQRLEQNLIKFQEHLQARFERMENVEVEEVNEETGAVTIKAQEPVKFLGFINGKATKRFELDNNGNVTEKHPWYSFLYAEDSE